MTFFHKYFVELATGDKLFGKYYLELPDTNLKFDKMDEYIKLAKDLGVEIIFKPE